MIIFISSDFFFFFFSSLFKSHIWTLFFYVVNKTFKLILSNREIKKSARNITQIAVMNCVNPTCTSCESKFLPFSLCVKVSWLIVNAAWWQHDGPVVGFRVLCFLVMGIWMLSTAVNNYRYLARSPGWKWITWFGLIDILQMSSVCHWRKK